MRDIEELFAAEANLRNAADTYANSKSNGTRRELRAAAVNYAVVKDAFEELVTVQPDGAVET